MKSVFASRILEAARSQNILTVNARDFDILEEEAGAATELFSATFLFDHNFSVRIPNPAKMNGVPSIYFADSNKKWDLFELKRLAEFADLMWAAARKAS